LRYIRYIEISAVEYKELTGVKDAGPSKIIK